MDDCPKNRMISGPADDDGKCRAEADSASDDFCTDVVRGHKSFFVIGF